MCITRFCVSLRHIRGVGHDWCAHVSIVSALLVTSRHQYYYPSILLPLGSGLRAAWPHTEHSDDEEGKPRKTLTILVFCRPRHYEVSTKRKNKDMLARCPTIIRTLLQDPHQKQTLVNRVNFALNSRTQIIAHISTVSSHRHWSHVAIKLTIPHNCWLSEKLVAFQARFRHTLLTPC